MANSKLMAKDFLVFEETTQGRLIIEHLVSKFGGSSFVEGGAEAARKTDFNCGARSVIEYILLQIDLAKNGEDKNV